MSVHYKFKSALDYDTVTFDGLHISVGDLKAAISQQKRIGKTSDFDLEITNAQTKEIYVDDHTLIPKNTSLLVARVPLAQQPKKQWEGKDSLSSSLHKDVAPNKGLADLSRMEGSEQDKINAMISQSTFDYDPSNYQKIRGQNQRGVVPSNYICFKCQKRGHWIKDCPIANSSEPVEIRRSTGIPRSFMVPVEGPKAPGAMMTPGGSYAVPAVDREAYLASENAGGGDSNNAPAAPETTVPDELICSLCRDLLTDAVMIPCCGNSFCDECIRGALLESEDHECPDCREKEIAPTTLIPNRFLRNSVSSFRNQTGYSRRMPHRPAAVPVQQPLPANPVPALGPPLMQPPSNGPVMAPINSNAERRVSAGEGEESDGSGDADDGITVTVPPAHAHRPRARGPPAAARASALPRYPRYGPPPGLKPVIEAPVNIPVNLPARLDERRSGTPTVDERRDPIGQVYNRGPPPGQFVPGAPPPNRPPYGPVVPFGRPPPLRAAGAAPFNSRFPLEPYQPPPPGIKDSPNGRGEDPLEAFNRMIREKEMKAKRREEERRRAASGSRSRSPRSPRSPRTPRPRARSSRSPRSPRSPRIRYSRSRSMSRGRVRRSPPQWSPRRRRTRERTLSLTRSPSPRRRHRSPLRYRSPLRSPPRSPPRSPLRSPPRSPLRSPLHSPLRSPPLRNSPRSPHRGPIRSPHARPMSPHRFAGVYDELLSPPRRNEPPYGARYGNRNNVPPTVYPPGMVIKPIPPLMGGPPISMPEPPSGFRGRYDGPPFDDVAPGVEPPVPGFEPPPFEKPPFGPPGSVERDRLPPPIYRDPYGPGYREMPGPPLSGEIPVVHVGEPPRFRENLRQAPPYRDQGPAPFRDGQPFREGPQVPYRDPNFRGPPTQFREGSYRNVPYRDGGFRENPPHGNFRDGPPPFRPPSADPRELVPPPNYHDPNYRESYRDDGPNREHIRPGYRPSDRPPRNRGGPRRNPEHDRHRDREAYERERYEGRENPERIRDPERRSGREGRPREYDRSRDYEKERDHDRMTPERKGRGSPKRIKEPREKRRSESRGRSRERENKREKKEERIRDKSDDRTKEHKEKEKKMKERKKKKREKEKDGEKKKKREKKDKKEKESSKKEDDENVKDEVDMASKDETVSNRIESDENIKESSENPIKEEVIIKKEESPKVEPANNPMADLYGEEASEAVDKEIMQNYVKNEDNLPLPSLEKEIKEDVVKEDPFDGIELQANVEELDLKPEPELAGNNNKEVLAPLPELSKWEVDEDNVERSKEPGEITSPDEEEDGGKVTSDVIKRAENAIFAKAINSLRPIEIKKISSDRLKLYGDEPSKPSLNNIQITVPVIDSDQRSLGINEKKRRYSKTPPPRLSVKERLGGKVDDVRRGREPRVVHSTVERVKSRSRTPKKELAYRRVTVDKGEKGRKQDSGRLDLPKSERRVVTENLKIRDKQRILSSQEKLGKDVKRSQSQQRERGFEKVPSNLKHINDRERKKSTLDEAHFEPDYDETVESENENKEETAKKRERSASPGGNETKKAKVETETIKLDLTNVKKKAETGSDSSSDSGSSSSTTSEDRKRKKKKKRSKKKKKRAASDSESESASDSDDHKKKKKKRKHKKKSSKKKKKSKHK